VASQVDEKQPTDNKCHKLHDIAMQGSPSFATTYDQGRKADGKGFREAWFTAEAPEGRTTVTCMRC
jgi:hypothetical protein